MSDNYFAELGRAMASELVRNPAQVQRIRHFANNALNKHLSGPMAKDAMPSNFVKRAARDQETIDPDLQPRGGLNNGANGANGAEAPSARDLIQMIKICASKLSPEGREEFLLGLSEVPDQDATNGGAPANNLGSLDRGNGARDGFRPVARGQGIAGDRRRVAAHDAAINARNNRSFDARWGNLTDNVRVLG